MHQSQTLSTEHNATSEFSLFEIFVSTVFSFHYFSHSKHLYTQATEHSPLLVI